MIHAYAFFLSDNLKIKFIALGYNLYEMIISQFFVL